MRPSVDDPLEEALRANTSAYQENREAVKEIQNSSQNLAKSLDKARKPFSEMELFIRNNNHFGG